ncbi:DMT family transporter [Isoptericola sp. 4D.3]|uniref:DMT family transporter n=1 Tax=Isoptericola peretonis TaxID=2918523 RepID=A0ABT0J889_9MICO|nr:DMT family transporter [Isoptericola sp. 4D.3]
MGKQICIPRPWVTALASAAFVLSWSSGFLGAKVGTGQAPVVTLLLWRFVVVAAVLVAALGLARLLRPRRRTASPAARVGTAPGLDGPRAVAHHVVVGLLSQLGYVLPVYGAIALGVSTGTTSLVDAVQPVLVATLVGPLLGQHVRALQWAGLATAFAGVAALVAADLRVTTAPPWAYALPAAAVASLVAATFLERRRPADLAPAPMLAVHAVAALACLTVIALVTGTATPPPDAAFWASTVLLALVPSLVAYALYWFLLRRVDVTTLNALLFLVVPTTTLAGAALFGEPLSPAVAAGLVLSGLGVAAVVHGEARGRGRPRAGEHRGDDDGPQRP